MTNFTFHIPDNAVVVGLCAGRHDMPVGEFIFPTEVDPTDFRAMSRTVDAFLDNRVGTHLSNYGTRFNDNEMSDIEVVTGDRPLVVYVTGLTACVAAVIRGCVYRGIEPLRPHHRRLLAAGGSWKHGKLVQADLRQHQKGGVTDD